MDWLGLTEVVGGLAGIAGSIVLAVPAWRDLKNKDLWDLLTEIRSVPGASETDLRELKWMILDSVLGGYRLHQRCTILGAVLLVLGFALIAGAEGLRVLSVVAIT